jgi:hypothetical protein
MIKAWVNDVNTTSLRIVVSVGLAAIAVVIVLIGVTMMRWEPTPAQQRVLIGVAGVILTMMGFDVLQFVGKRFSDAEYQRAKQGPSPVNVEAPSTVSVSAAAPASDGVAAPSAPAQPAARPGDAVPALQAAVTVIDHTQPIGTQVPGEGD